LKTEIWKKLIGKNLILKHNKYIIYRFYAVNDCGYIRKSQGCFKANRLANQPRETKKHAKWQKRIPVMPIYVTFGMQLINDDAKCNVVFHGNVGRVK
jgi:hypothetical protein